MKKFLVASAAALGSTLIGVLNSIVVVRLWPDVAAAEFFQVASLAILVAVVGEAGLGNYAVHDSAKRRGTPDEQRYVNQALRVAARRGMPAAAAAALLGHVVFGFGPAAAGSAAVATWSTAVAIVAQSLFRGLGRDLLASLGGPVGATILSGVAVGVGAIARGLDPVHLAALGYTVTGVASYLALWRPTPHVPATPADLSLRRTTKVGVGNVCNAAGRQLDIWIAGVLLSGAAFNSYALATKIAASVGVVAYAARQASAADTFRWVGGDAEAGRSIRSVQLLGLTVTVVLSGVCIVLAPPLGTLVFGADIALDRGVLAVLLLGYVLTAFSGSAMIVLVAAERSDIVLTASLTALFGALVMSGTVAYAGGTSLAAAAFGLGWLGLVALYSGGATQRSLNLTTFVTPMPRPNARVQ